MVGPTTLLLVCLGLISHRFRGLVLEWCVRRWRRQIVLTLLCLTVALGSSAVWVPLAGLLLGLSLLSVLLISLSVLLQAHAHARTPQRRYLVYLGVALFWHLSLRLLVSNQPMASSTEGAADFWFIDYFVRVWLVTVAPLVQWMGMEASIEATLLYLAPALTFLSDQMMPLLFAWSFVAATLLYRLVAPDVNVVPSQPRPSRLPVGLTGLMGLSWLASLLALGIGVDTGVARWPGVVSGYLGVLHVIYGLALLQTLIGTCVGAAWGRAGLLVVCLTCILPPTLWWGPLLLGVGRALAPDRPTVVAAANRDAHLTHGWSTALRRRWPLGLFVFYLGALWFAGHVGTVQDALAMTVEASEAHAGTEAGERSDARPDEPSHPVSPQASLVTPSGETYWMDRYEYPNRRGAEVMVGLTPDEADAKCQARGQRPCTLEEWVSVCTDGSQRDYIFDDPEVGLALTDGLVLAEATKHCNLEGSPRRSEGAEGLSLDRAWAAGTSETCRGRLAIYDLVGNVFEWVRIEGWSGLSGLMGASFRYRDQRSIRCSTPILGLDGLMQTLDLASVGFRCCGREKR